MLDPEAVTFFRVSKLAHRRPERQCNLVRDRNPAKGKPLLRQGAQMANVHGQGDVSLNGLTEAPQFSRLLLWGKLHRLSAAQANAEGAGHPHIKSLKKTRG